MNATVVEPGSRAAELRRAFDQSFSEAPAGIPAATADLLGLRIGTGSYAVHLSEIGGLFLDRRIARFPGAAPPALGIAALQGLLVPVYDLAGILGLISAPEPRRLLLAAARPLAFAVDGFEGLLRWARAEVGAERDHAQFVREVAGIGGSRRLILDLGEIVASIENEWDATTRGPAEG